MTVGERGGRYVWHATTAVTGGDFIRVVRTIVDDGRASFAARRLFRAARAGAGAATAATTGARRAATSRAAASGVAAAFCHRARAGTAAAVSGSAVCGSAPAAERTGA